MPFPKPYRAVFWDNDGVLVDTERLFYEANRQILAEHDIQLDWPTFVDISLRRGERLLALADHLFPDGGHQVLLQRRNERYSDMLRQATPEQLCRPGIMDVLHHFHGRIKMGIVSSCRREHFNLIHRRTGILPLMDFIINMEDCPVTKPDPYPYRLALSRAGVEPAEAVAIEDAERGVISARGANIDVIALTAPVATGEDFSAATAQIADIRELTTYITLPVFR